MPLPQCRKSLILLLGTVVFLGGCGAFDEPNSNVAPTKKTDAELEQIVFRPAQLTLKEALKKYGKTVYNNPKVDSAMFTEAAVFASNSADNEAAETLCSEAIRLDPNNAKAYFYRGRVRCNAISGKENAAEDDLKKALALGYLPSDVYLILGRLYDEKKQPEKAIECFSKAISIAPQLKELYKSRAAIYAALGEKEKALKDYERLATLDPSSSAPYFQQGQVLESMKKYDAACAMYKRLLKIDESAQRVPLKAIALKRLALLSGMKGKHEDAISYLTEASKYDVEDDEPLRMRGLEYMALKNYAMAIADFSEAIDINPDSSHNFAARAEAYLKAGKPDLASKDKAEAVRLNNVPAERPMYELK